MYTKKSFHLRAQALNSAASTHITKYLLDRCPQAHRIHRFHPVVHHKTAGLQLHGIRASPREAGGRGGGGEGIPTGEAIGDGRRGREGVITSLIGWFDFV